MFLGLPISSIFLLPVGGLSPEPHMIFASGQWVGEWVDWVVVWLGGWVVRRTEHLIMLRRRLDYEA